jgi:hypothetical protein
MAHKPLIHITSFLTSLAIIAYPVAAMAGGQSHSGTPGIRSGSSSNITNCHQSTGGHPVSKPTTIENNLNVYKPININNNVNVYKPTTIDTNISVYKPIDINNNVNINNNINNSKNIDINKPVTITQNIDNSKNININKNIVINQGSSQAEAAAIAEATAASSASANSVVNVNTSSGNGSFASSASNSSAGSFGTSSGFVETPSMYVSDIGTIAVSAAEAPRECVYEQATVVKALHAICVAADGHEFPASHMVGDTWINNGYEGELARCLPGSHLKVVIGAVTQSSEGLAGSFSSGQTLECAPHEALRHFKDGMLKCAVAQPVPDCTERTNLRRYGTGDMFISYRTKVCLQTHQEYSEQMSREPSYN